MVMCKESSKPSKLSTKLSTIWQINDYLSKQIDNRLIVDIIDTRGHPATLHPDPSARVHLERPEACESRAGYACRMSKLD